MANNKGPRPLSMPQAQVQAIDWAEQIDALVQASGYPSTPIVEDIKRLFNKKPYGCYELMQYLSVDEDNYLKLTIPPEEFFGAQGQTHFHANLSFPRYEDGIYSCTFQVSWIPLANGHCETFGGLGQNTNRSGGAWVNWSSKRFNIQEAIGLGFFVEEAYPAILNWITNPQAPHHFKVLPTSPFQGWLYATVHQEDNPSKGIRKDDLANIGFDEFFCRSSVLKVERGSGLRAMGAKPTYTVSVEEINAYAAQHMARPVANPPMVNPQTGQVLQTPAVSPAVSATELDAAFQ